MKKWTRVLAAAALVGALFMAVPGTGLSANLTGGTYTYVIQGQEQIFSFDPIVRKDGMLLPVEVFQGLNIKVDGALSQDLSLTRDAVTVKLTLGSTAITVNDKADTVATAALRVGGRVFLPADLLRQFGIDFATDGNYVFMRPYTDQLADATQLTDSEYSGLKAAETVSGMVKLDSSVVAGAEFTLLNAEMIDAANLGLSYGVRAKLDSLLQTNTLVLVKVSNTSFRAGALVTGGFYLVDSQRNQYDTPSVVDIGNGLISNKVAPGADRGGVLVFPKLADNAGSVSLYYDNNQATLGTFANK